MLTKFKNQPWPLKQSEEDTIFINKTNPKDIDIKWEYNQVTSGDLRKYYDTFLFNSSIAQKVYKANTWYMAHEFKFRLGSEH